MHLVRTGKPHELREVLDITRCSGCGEPFAPRLHTLSWTQCGCVPDRTGHRLVICLRDGCRAVTPDPPCRGQYGPTADYA